MSEIKELKRKDGKPDGRRLNKGRPRKNTNINPSDLQKMRSEVMKKYYCFRRWNDNPEYYRKKYLLMKEWFDSLTPKE